VVQLTGLSDALYAEAYVTVHQYDISLDVSVINRTGDTMQARVASCHPPCRQPQRHCPSLPALRQSRCPARLPAGRSPTRLRCPPISALQNVTLELATMGDLRLVERPQAHTLVPGAQKEIHANIKVSSTETGAIFGNLVYEATGYADRRCARSPRATAAR
jgi:coatomer subunit beta